MKIQLLERFLNYWFSQVPSDTTPITQEMISFWFMRNGHVDDLIRSNFMSTWEKAVKGECDHWAKSSRGVVALVILLDQFTRNMFRDTKKMFEGDQKALEIVEKALANGEDKLIPLYHRFWLYVVLQRKEDIKYGEKQEKYYAELAKESKATGKSEQFYQTGHNISNQQLDILRRFGRYPIRNAVLGRESTKEEVEYLASSTYFST